MTVTREAYSVKIQMILSVIPFVDLWAAYRIEKLQFWIVYWIGMIMISLALTVIGEPTTEFIIALAIETLIAVFLMRYFTMEWNQKIKSE